jgi:hypothetical protein
MQIDFYPYRDEEGAIDGVHGNLIGHAMRRSYQFYSECEAETGIQTNFERNPQHRNWWFGILGQITQREIDAGRPPLTAIVVKKDGKFISGDGFFGFLHKLGIIPNPEKMSKEQKRQLHNRYLNEVWDYWNGVYQQRK